MIISRTPYRISFFGGGTDYPGWYAEEEGAVISTTIDKYCYITCRVLPPFFSNRHRIIWSYIENVGSVSEILHPAVREGMKYLGFGDSFGLEIQHQGDLPARSGMGSSSSFSVGLIKALTALRGQMVTKQDLAMMAIELEQKVLKENVGSQDQMAAAYGGLNLIHFGPGGSIKVEPVTVQPSRTRDLQSRFMLYYTGTSRLASEVAVDVISNLQQKTAALRAMREMVYQSLSILNGDGDLDDFGRLLHESWMLKRDLASKVTNSTIDGIYETARRSGALGGKLLGAGSSGFMLFYVPRERQPAVRKALAHYLNVPFKFETEGSTIIHYGIDEQESQVLSRSLSNETRAVRRNSVPDRVVQH